MRQTGIQLLLLLLDVLALAGVLTMTVVYGGLVEEGRRAAAAAREE